MTPWPIVEVTHPTPFCRIRGSHECYESLAWSAMTFSIRIIKYYVSIPSGSKPVTFQEPLSQFSTGPPLNQEFVWLLQEVPPERFLQCDFLKLCHFQVIPWSDIWSTPSTTATPSPWPNPWPSSPPTCSSTDGRTPTCRKDSSSKTDIYCHCPVQINRIAEPRSFFTSFRTLNRRGSLGDLWRPAQPEFWLMEHCTPLDDLADYWKWHGHTRIVTIVCSLIIWSLDTETMNYL